MFQPLRVLPVLIGLAALLMLAKAADLGVTLQAAILGQDEPEMMAGEPLVTAAGVGEAAIELALPPAPEEITAALESELEAIQSEGAESDPEGMTEPAAAEEGTDGAGSAESEAEAADDAGAMMAMPPEPEIRDPFDISDEELALLQRLVERREALERRADNLDQREALLAATEARIADKMSELKALQGLIESLLVQHDEQEEAQMQSLVKIYESMKPKEAARIFGELDMVVLLDVIGRMKERKSAPILAKMNPERAKAVTLELAQRRELPVARQ